MDQVARNMVQASQMTRNTGQNTQGTAVSNQNQHQ